MDPVEVAQAEANIEKLYVEAAKLRVEERYYNNLDQREGWRLFLYAIATGGGVVAVLVAAAKLGSGNG